MTAYTLSGSGCWAPHLMEHRLTDTEGAHMEKGGDIETDTELQAMRGAAPLAGPHHFYEGGSIRYKGLPKKAGRRCQSENKKFTYEKCSACRLYFLESLIIIILKEPLQVIP